MKRPFLEAWLLCGVLDIAYAAAAAQVMGRSPLAMLRAIAAGPFGNRALEWGVLGSAAGLAIHFAIMAAMVAGGFWLARRTLFGEISPWKAGIFYGLMLYSVMAGIVLKWRYGLPFPNPDRMRLAIDLFPHVFLVGVPTFLIARRAMNTSPSS